MTRLTRLFPYGPIPEWEHFATHVCQGREFKLSNQNGGRLEAIGISQQFRFWGLHLAQKRYVVAFKLWINANTTRL